MPQPQSILTHTFDNGLILIAQPMPWLESAAVSIDLPAGCRFDPASKRGLANLVSEMVQRGCGQLDSRQFIESLELMGVDFRSGVSTYKSSYSGAMPAAQLLPSLAVFADLVRRPHLPLDQLADAKLVCAQSIKGLDDDLSQKVLLELRSRFYGSPDGYHPEGTMESLANIELSDIQSFFSRHYSPVETVIVCAGKLDWDLLRERVESLLGDWQGSPVPEVIATSPVHGTAHIPFDSEQTHIAVAYPGVPYSHSDYFLSRGAIGVLSGGVSSRLFTEIREKRALCYSVYAYGHSLKDCGSVIACSGTSTDRAQETLDVLLEQLDQLHNGVREDELKRLKIQLKTNLVAQQESCRARANSMATDWFHLGRVRTLDEVSHCINGLTVDAINGFLASHRPPYYDVVTLGAQPLKVKLNGISTAPTE